MVYLQVTLWGPEGGELTEYAYKLWSGLISSYYVPRWQQWMEAVVDVMDVGLEFNEGKFMGDLQKWEEAWTRQPDNPFATSPSGDAFTIANGIYSKYFTPQ